MYFEDLAPCSYFSYWDNLVAVGWLDANNRFTKGPLIPGFLEKLVLLAEFPFQPVIRMGGHGCDFCNELPSKASHNTIELLNKKILIGIYNYFIPFKDDQVFIAPSLILHYITSHNYCPPEIFQQAVLDCPPMKSPEYFDLVRNSGLLDIPTIKPPG